MFLFPMSLLLFHVTYGLPFQKACEADISTIAAWGFQWTVDVQSEPLPPKIYLSY